MFSISSITRKTATFGLAATIALTAVSMPAAAERGNSTETGHGVQVTRETRSQGQQTLRGEGEWGFIDYTRGDLLMASRIDFGSTSGARYGVDLMADGDLLEESGFDVDGTFRVRDIDGCEGINISLDGLAAYVVVCADGDYVNMVIGTDKSVVLDTAEDMQDGFEPTAPRGYVEESLP